MIKCNKLLCLAVKNGLDLAHSFLKLILDYKDRFDTTANVFKS